MAIRRARRETTDSRDSGTFTATLGMQSNPDSTNPTVSHTTTSTGVYSKVGNICVFNFSFDVTSFSNYLAVNVTGLPFTSRNFGSGYPIVVSGLRGIRFRYSTTVLTDFILFANVNAGQSTISLGATSAANAFSGYFYINNEPGQGKSFSLGGSYVVA